MEGAPEDAKSKDQDIVEKELSVRNGDEVRVRSRKSSGDVPKHFEVQNSASHKAQDVEKVAKAPFTNTRRKMRSFRRGVKKFWDLWSGFKNISAPVTPKKKKSSQTSGVPGFQEIACIDVDMPDIMMTEKDRIRTSCKQCVKNPPQFPTKEQVKSKLIAADKYYGVNKSAIKPYSALKRSGSLEHDADYFDEDGKIIRPSWRFILERPLVEQYVLMTNYIRKISILSELEGTQYDQTIEEDDSGSDTEYEKFTEKHKIETRNFLDSMKAPMMKETAVQTSMKSNEGLLEPVSETSLYPDSGSSNESAPSKELSAVTIVTSRDLSSPLQSDLETISIANAARVKNAVKWWESKEPPQMSESFPTSCDSVRNVSVSSRAPAKIQNEPVKDTSGSGSDGMSIPVHCAAGKTSLFKLDARENNQRSGAIIKTGIQTKLTQGTSQTVEKGTTTQKRVKFSPVVEYFNAPEKNNAIFTLPKPDEDDNAETTGVPVDVTSQRLKDTQNAFSNKTLLTLSPNQKHIVLQLGSTPKEGNRGFSIVQNYSARGGPGVTGYSQQDSNKSATNDRKSLSERVPDKPFIVGKPGGSSSEYRSTSLETDSVQSSSDYRSSPERMSAMARYEKHSEENKESSSNSSERIELKPSPAVFFKPSVTSTGASQITNLATDKFYPEVPDIDEDKEERFYRKSMYLEERRDVRSFPVAENRVSVAEERQLSSSTANQGFVKVVIVRGTPPTENKGNQIQSNNQQGNKHDMKSLEIDERREVNHLQHGTTPQERRRIGPERFYENYNKIEDDVEQASYLHQAREVATSRVKQTSVYSTLYDDLNAVARASLNIDYGNSSRNHTVMHQSYFNPSNIEQQGNDESRNSRTHQYKTAAYQGLQTIPEPSNGKEFLNTKARKDCATHITTGSARSITEEERCDLKRETHYVHRQEPEADECVHDRNMMSTENNSKGSTRTSVVTSTLTNDHILHKISEENYSATKIRLDSVSSIRGGIKLESQEKVRDRCSYEDFSKFDVLKLSQIYSSSSSFVTPSEERMAFGLSKVEGTLFQPMLVEDITPEVSMMPSKTEKSIVSLDRSIVSASISNAAKDIDEYEVNKYPSQEQKRNEQEIKYVPLTQVQYTKQFEILVPCYTLIDNVQYATQNEVDFRTEEIVLAETTQFKDEEDNEKVIAMNIEYMLQKVHETIHRQTDRNQSEGKNEENNNTAQKQWLMDVIPTVTRTDAKTSEFRQHKVNPRLQLGNSPSASPHPTDVKPVFKFLKRQKEMEKNSE